MRHFVIELVCFVVVFAAGYYMHGHLGFTMTYACDSSTHVMMFDQANTEFQ